MKRVMAGFIVLLFLVSASNEANAAMSRGCDHYDPPRSFVSGAVESQGGARPFFAGERITIGVQAQATVTVEFYTSPILVLASSLTVTSDISFVVPVKPQGAFDQIRVFVTTIDSSEWSLGCEAAPAAPPQAPVPAMFTDGRINPHPGAPVAMWCQEDDGLVVYGIDANSQGYLSLYAPPDLIASVPTLPNANTLIATGANGVRLYRLSTGELQVNAPASDGKEYVYLWNDCAPDSGVRYYILGG